MLGSKEDAEDVLQEVFAAAFNAILADDRPINARPWLYRIARNRSLNHLRRQQPIGVDSMDVHLSEHGATTADKVHKREEFLALMDDVKTLPETQRTAVWLVHACGWRYADVAEAMETSVSMVGNHVSRALQACALSLDRSPQPGCGQTMLARHRTLPGAARSSSRHSRW